MNSRNFVRAYFVATGTACLGLAALWWWLRLPVVQPRVAPPPAVVPVAPPPTDSPDAAVPAKPADEPARPADKRPEYFRYASQSCRAARAAAVLAWVERTKASPRPEPGAELPPPPRSLMGNWFPELLNDPEFGAEYRRLYREMLRSSRSAAAWSGLAAATSDVRREAEALGDPAVVGWVSDRQMAMLERMSLPKDQKDGTEAQALRAQQDRIEAQLRERLGTEAYERLTTGKGLEFEGVLNQLEQRLSYSAAPLTATQRTDLKTALAGAAQLHFANAADAQQRLVGGLTGKDQETLVEQMLQSAGAVLPPAQLAAFREVQDERLAIYRRRKLPPESELPKPPGT